MFVNSVDGGGEVFIPLVHGVRLVVEALGLLTVERQVGLEAGHSSMSFLLDKGLGVEVRVDLLVEPLSQQLWILPSLTLRKEVEGSIF